MARIKQARKEQPVHHQALVVPVVVVAVVQLVVQTGTNRSSPLLELAQKEEIIRCVCCYECKNELHAVCLCDCIFESNVTVLQGCGVFIEQCLLFTSSVSYNCRLRGLFL